MRVIGIDPGIARTGYGVVERAGSSLHALAFGAIRTGPEASQGDRLTVIRAGLASVIAAQRPDAAAIERLFFNANVRTAMAVGQASGIALLAAAEAGLEIAHYTPLEVKQSVAGVGSARKRQVQAMVAALLGLASAPTPADAADACALAICHLNRQGLARAVARAHLSSESR
jgi:crossover junction endodeoxyribonuclease RuvC